VTMGCPDLAEPFHAQSAPVWELAVSVPPPCCGHRKSEDSAVAQQILTARSHVAWSRSRVQPGTSSRVIRLDMVGFTFCAKGTDWARSNNMA
jgi:hypothetical protein